MTSPNRRPGPDSTLGDVRTKLIDAGIRLLRQRGVDLGFADITLIDAISEAGVTRSTAYRSLVDHDLAPQAVLHRELLTYLLTRYTRTDSRDAIESAVAVELERHEHAMASGGPAERTAAMRDVIRAGANASYEGVIESPERAILTTLYGALRSSATTHDWRHEALAAGEQGLNRQFSELYSGLTKLFDYQIKPPFSMDQFASAAASLVEGIAMRHGFNDHLAVTKRPTGFDGAMQEWSLFAVAFEAMAIGMLEPANPQEPFADLSRF